MSPQVLNRSTGVIGGDVAVETSDKAEAYVAARQLGEQYDQARAIAEDVFSDMTDMHVELQTDPGDETATPTIVLGIVTAAASADFCMARKRFFRRLREAGCDKLCLSLAVVRE